MKSTAHGRHLAFALLTLGFIPVSTSIASAGDLEPVVVLDFGTAGVSPCPASSTPPTVATGDLAASVRDALSDALAARDDIRVYPDLASAPFGSLVVSGCITRADPGDSFGRTIGMGLGASELDAEVTLARKERHALRPIDRFDASVTGENVLPPIGPIGLIVHKAKGRHETLQADAPRLGRKIALAVGPQR